MSRPSLKHQRSEEILDAFMACVARYGLDGATLEKIAEEAGVGRPLIRHYLGNREEMVAKLLDHVIANFERLTDAMFSSLPEERRFEVFMDRLFGKKDYSAENAAVFQALVAAAERYAGIENQLMGFVLQFEKKTAKEFLRHKPHAELERCKVAASGVTAIYFNTSAIMPLNPGPSWRKLQRRAAQSLVDSLG
ncbi:MAG: TetR/AcrR family transcriptional regulator [Pseudomonadota bacterium]